jgi:hypothetical protein
MFKILPVAQCSRTFGMGMIAGVALAVASSSKAADEIQPPPYQAAGMNGVSVSVVWDEATIRKALPPGIEPAKGMTGGINIASAERVYPFGSYSVTYFYVDVEGFDSPEGIKGRWMLAGVFGPQTNPSAAFKTYYGLPVRPGTSHSELSADTKRAVGTVDRQDFVTIEYKSVSGSCKPVAILLNYISLSPKTKEIGVLKAPFVGDFCKAELVSAKVNAPSGDPFSDYPISKFVGVSEFRNGSSALGVLQPAKE